MFADRLRFKQILSNLLSNAVKFTPQLGRISISASSLRGWPARNQLKLRFKNGNWIRWKNSTPSLMNSSSQAATTTKGVREGTGLGLAITRRLVEMHGGEISGGQQARSGSRFTFHFR